MPYEAVVSTRQTWLRGGSLVVTVLLREPAVELRRFAYVAAYAPGIQAGIEHPIVTELARRVDTAKRGAGGAW